MYFQLAKITQKTTSLLLHFCGGLCEYSYLFTRFSPSSPLRNWCGALVENKMGRSMRSCWHNCSYHCLGFLSIWTPRFGAPLYVKTKSESKFESELFRELSSIIGFHQLKTTAYHSQGQGTVGRFHRTLKAAIMARDKNWFDVLSPIPNPCIPNKNGFSLFIAVTGTTIFPLSSLISGSSPKIQSESL